MPIRAMDRRARSPLANEPTAQEADGPAAPSSSTLDLPGLGAVSGSAEASVTVKGWVSEMGVEQVLVAGGPEVGAEVQR